MSVRPESVVAALDLVAGWDVPTAAAVVFEAGGVLGTAGDPDRPFALASVTKPLAALAVLVAVEEEALGLDDPLDVPALLGRPGLPAPASSVTARHLLAHASGLDPEGTRWLFAPATRRVYSNAGIEAAAAAVTAASGIDFPRYFVESLVAPLRLANTTLPGSPAHAGRASARDVAAVMAQFLAPTELLHETTLLAARTAQWPGLRGVLPGYGGQDDNAWGLGLELRDHKHPHWTGARNSPGTVGHFGQSGTMTWVDPEAGLGVVALTDRAFGPWAATAWPEFSDAVLRTVTR